MDKSQWRMILAEELPQWTAKSYADLRVELADVVNYEREGVGGPYQVGVELLENRPEYVHVSVSVCGPHGLLCIPVCGSFIRYADGRLDA